jgi:UrcA family protein
MSGLAGRLCLEEYGSRKHEITLRRRGSPRTIFHLNWESTRNISKKSCGGLVVIFCATLTVGFSAPANATDLTGPDITVQYENLAIDAEQGAAQLLKRIEAAAARVCARLDHGNLASRGNAQACSRQLTADAVGKVSHPLLLAVYNSKGQVAPPVASLTK